MSLDKNRVKGRNHMEILSIVLLIVLYLVFEINIETDERKKV